MTFPKAPSKPKSSKLRLVIRPADAEVQVETGPQIPAGPQDGVIKFKPPAGFTVDTNLNDLLTRQINAALVSLIEIESRYKKCKPCRDKGYNPEILDLARDTVKVVGAFLRGGIKDVPKLVISHEKSGDIYLQADYLTRTVLICFSVEGLSQIYAAENKYIMLTDASLEESLEWLIGE